MRYKATQNGEWVRPRPVEFRLACCDCSLIHKVDFRVRRGKIEFRVFRDMKATTARRKRLNISLEAT